MQNQLIKLFLIVSVLIGFCQVANEASAVQVNVNLLNSEFPEVNDIPNSLNHKNGKAYPIEFGYCQPLEFSVFIPKDFGEIMLQDGKEVFKVPYIKAIHTKQDQIVYSGPASFNYEDSENVKLSSEASMRVPLYSLLDGLPIRHTQEGKLTITKIGAFDPGTDREISPKDAPKSLITAMKKIAGKCLVIRGDIYLSMVASPDYSYTIYTSIAIKRGNGSEEISNPVALSFVTYGRRFVLVDGESRAFDDNEIKFIVQNRNPGSNNYEKYLAHDLKTGMNFWTSNKNDSKIKEF
ncbi:MAG: hypothetical protein LBD38_05675, partial [Streptococcaceae bacterium]|nr:hypothetical protein [Streptococcaceae bacterium]